MVTPVTVALEDPRRPSAGRSRTAAGMTVGIDAGPLVGDGGISGYVGPLIRSLLALDPRPRYHLILRRGWLGHPAAGTLDALAPVTRLRVPDRVLALWWDRLGWSLPMGRALWRRLDLFLATCLVAPVLPRGRVVSIVYDLIPLRLPALFPGRDQFRRQVDRMVRRSAAIIAISRRTRQDLVELLAADPARVRVIYPGRGEAFRPAPPSRVADVATRLGIHGRYVLYLGALGPHKNVPALLQAYQRARLEGGLGAKLVVAGSLSWGDRALAALKTLQVRGDVVLTGPIPGDDLPALYTGADCFVFPSLYEGFGLPVLEAMSCGTPVIVSDRGALPEVVGQAAISVDPEKPAALATAMCRVSADRALRARLAAAGLVQAERFSWSRSAAELLALLHEVAEGKGHNA